MPIVESAFRPPWFLRNRHVQTIWPLFFRSVEGVTYRRERLELPDGDFLDLDWFPAASDRVAVLFHGVAGDSQAHYMRGMARALHRRGWNVVAVNARGCSGEPNRLPRTSHGGSSDDAAIIVDHVLAAGRFSSAALIGFSLGGNVLLKYLGECGAALPPAVRAAAAASVPCDLRAAAQRLAAPGAYQWVYSRRFFDSIRAKLRLKRDVMPAAFDWKRLDRVRTFRELDDLVTAPLNGFRDAEHYWAASSCQGFLSAIQLPTLLLNAADDPVLSRPCFPYREARRSPYLWLETPGHGGHLGFMGQAVDGAWWLEHRIAGFVDSCGKDADSRGTGSESRATSDAPVRSEFRRDPLGLDRSRSASGLLDPVPLDLDLGYR